MQGSFCAFLDSNVLYPVSLRNLLMRLALADLYQPRWSADVHEGWMQAVLQDRPDIPRERLEGIRAAMDREAEEAIVTGYQPLIAGLALPDPDDRHVLAAAIVGQADIIVTRNLRDFPDDALAPYNIGVQHPDEFVRHLLDLAPRAGRRRGAQSARAARQSADLDGGITGGVRAARACGDRRGIEAVTHYMNGRVAARLSQPVSKRTSDFKAKEYLWRR
jgi:hypothetical protein